MFHRLTPDVYKNLTTYPDITYGIATSPYGPMSIAWWPQKKGDAVCYLSLHKDLQKITEQLHDRFPHNVLVRDDKKASAFAKAYHPTNKPVSVLMKSTPFFLDVWETLYKTKPGHTLSYGELAIKAGRPLASRAVGQSMATNPVALIVPCHRVISANGGLGGYGYGPVLKQRLLDAEKA